MFELVYNIFHYTEVWSIYLIGTFNKSLHVEYLFFNLFNCFFFFFFFLGDLLIQLVAFPFLVLILFSKFTQSPLFSSYVNLFKSSLLEDLLIQSVAFPFLVLILYSKFSQSPFVFILC